MSPLCDRRRAGLHSVHYVPERMAHYPSSTARPRAGGLRPARHMRYIKWQLPEDSTVYIRKVRFYSEGGADTTPPTPNPSTWATVPYATGSTSISMTATTASDPSGVQYYFDCTAGAGGHDSGWQIKRDLSGYRPDAEHAVHLSRADARPEHKSEHRRLVNDAVGDDAGSS